MPQIFDRDLATLDHCVDEGAGRRVVVVAVGTAAEPLCASAGLTRSERGGTTYASGAAGSRAVSRMTAIILIHLFCLLKEHPMLIGEVLL